MRFHHQQFSDPGQLMDWKGNQRVTVCIPTLNEEETIGEIVATVRRELMDAVPLVDELLVIDSGSTDATRRIAAKAGAAVHLASDIPPTQEAYQGKGENLWKALHISTGDIVCYIDGDIVNFHGGFVTGLIGPLLQHEHIDFVKAYYERPLRNGDGSHSSGGGRVSGILIRPLLSLFYPELTSIYQPLAGEYAARRPLLETLAFPSGYGVEIAHLLDLLAAGKLSRIGQTDLVKRIHRNRDDADLGKMAFSILQVIFRRLERDGKLDLTQPLPDLYQSWMFEGSLAKPVHERLPEHERPPIHTERIHGLPLEC